MTDLTDPEEESPKKSSRLPMLVGVVLALAGAGGGFFAVQSGLILGTEAPAEAAAPEVPQVPLNAGTFVPIDALVIALPSESGRSHLRFRAQLEVEPEYANEITTIMPRIVDVLNGYLRAVSVNDFEDPEAFVRLRSQMLRRVQVVAGRGRVKDLLIMDLVLD